MFASSGFDPPTFWLWAKHASTAPRREWAFLYPAQDLSSNRVRTYVQWFYWPPAKPLAYRAKKYNTHREASILRPLDYETNVLPTVPQCEWAFLHPARDQSSNRDRTYVQWFLWPPAIPLAYRAEPYSPDKSPASLVPVNPTEHVAKPSPKIWGACPSL